MQSKTAKLVNEQRVIELLECYGGDADNWPEEERTAANAMIRNSAQLQHRQREASRLDEMMAATEVKASLSARPDPATVARIINALPEQADSNTTTLSDYRAKTAHKRAAKRNKGWWTYGTAAAAAVMVLTVGIMLRQPLQPIQPTAITAAVAQQELDQWMWQEATGRLAGEPTAELAPEDADSTITFLAMVELDLLPEEE